MLAPNPHSHSSHPQPLTPAADDGSKVPVYWAWLLAAGIPTLVCAMLDRSQMGLIFDLDETLLVAHSSNTAESRMESCRKARYSTRAQRCVPAPAVSSSLCPPLLYQLHSTPTSPHMHRLQMLETLSSSTGLSAQER